VNPWRWVDPRAKDVRYGDLERYLRRHGWQTQPNPNPKVVKYVKDFGKGFRPVILLPATEVIEDIPDIISTITNLSEYEGRHPIEVLNDILALAPAANDAAVAKGAKAPRRAAASE
jgi:hypothetical protein